MFATLAFGLGFPYLVALNALPKPGEWMVTVKKGMGFVLMAMAFYFLRPLIGRRRFKWGVAASLLIGAAFLFFKKSQEARTCVERGYLLAADDPDAALDNLLAQPGPRTGGRWRPRWRP